MRLEAGLSIGGENVVHEVSHGGLGWEGLGWEGGLGACLSL